MKKILLVFVFVLPIILSLFSFESKKCSSQKSKNPILIGIMTYLGKEYISYNIQTRLFPYLEDKLSPETKDHLDKTWEGCHKGNVNNYHIHYENCSVCSRVGDLLINGENYLKDMKIVQAKVEGINRRLNSMNNAIVKNRDRSENNKVEIRKLDGRVSENVYWTKTNKENLNKVEQRIGKNANQIRENTTNLNRLSNQANENTYQIGVNRNDLNQIKEQVWANSYQIKTNKENLNKVEQRINKNQDNIENYSLPKIKMLQFLNSSNDSQSKIKTFLDTECYGCTVDFNTLTHLRQKQIILVNPRMLKLAQEISRITNIDLIDYKKTNLLYFQNFDIIIFL